MQMTEGEGAQAVLIEMSLRTELAGLRRGKPIGPGRREFLVLFALGIPAALGAATITAIALMSLQASAKLTAFAAIAAMATVGAPLVWVTERMESSRREDRIARLESAVCRLERLKEECGAQSRGENKVNKGCYFVSPTVP